MVILTLQSAMNTKCFKISNIVLMNTHRIVPFWIFLKDLFYSQKFSPRATFSFLWLKVKQIIHFMDLGLKIKVVRRLAISAQSFLPPVDQIPAAQPQPFLSQLINISGREINRYKGSGKASPYDLGDSSSCYRGGGEKTLMGAYQVEHGLTITYTNSNHAQLKHNSHFWNKIQILFCIMF